MKKYKEITSFILTIIFLLSLIVGTISFKYYIWRIEHPDAPTWVFFIPKN